MWETNELIAWSAQKTDTSCFFHFGAYPTSLPLHSQALLSPFSAEFYKRKGLEDLSVSGPWPFPFPGIPKPEDQVKIWKYSYYFFLCLPQGSTLLFFRKSEVFWRLASQQKEIIKTDIRNPPDVDPGKCPYGEESAGRKDWTASKPAAAK